jgi:site-specific recombinase XerD
MAKRTRGSGHLFHPPGSKNWSVQFYVGRLRYREATGTSNRREAERYLREKLADACLNGRPTSAKLTVGNLVEAKLVSDQNNGLKDIKSSRGRWEKNLKPFFGPMKARDLTTPVIDRYVERRRQELLAKYAKQHNGESDEEYGERMKNQRKSPNASINRELSVLRGAFFLARKSRLVRDVPYFPMLKEDNVRRGFLEPGEYERLAAAAMAEGLWMRTLFELGYAYGWRRSEMLGRIVRDLDFLGGPNGEGTIALPTSKNGDPRIVTMTRRVRELLLLCCKGKSAEDRVLTRDGQPIVDYRDAWARVLKAAGIKRHLLVHDLRRTAIRGMRDRGIDRKVAMSITGHRTEAVYNRYNIADLADIAKATAKLDEEQKTLGDSQGLAKVASQGVQGPQPLKAKSNFLNRMVGGPSRIRTCDQRIMRASTAL